MSEIVPSKPKFRTRIPDAWRKSIDTRLYWLWNQRLGTVQTIRDRTDDVLDRMAAELIMDAVYSDNLGPLTLVLNRLEGGPTRESVHEEDTLRV